MLTVKTSIFLAMVAISHKPSGWFFLPAVFSDVRKVEHFTIEKRFNNPLDCELAIQGKLERIPSEDIERHQIMVEETKCQEIEMTYKVQPPLPRQRPSI